jgi:hypothetical protein
MDAEAIMGLFVESQIVGPCQSRRYDRKRL